MSRAFARCIVIPMAHPAGHNHPCAHLNLEAPTLGRPQMPNERPAMVVEELLDDGPNQPQMGAYCPQVCGEDPMASSTHPTLDCRHDPLADRRSVRVRVGRIRRCDWKQSPNSVMQTYMPPTMFLSKPSLSVLRSPAKNHIALSFVCLGGICGARGLRAATQGCKPASLP